MPININTLKSLSEDLCYIKHGASSSLREYLIKYLKENKDKAYSVTELVPIFRAFRDNMLVIYNAELSKIDADDDDLAEQRALHKKLIINDGGSRIKAKIFNSLKTELNFPFPRIKKKGSYYWYEENKEE